MSSHAMRDAASTPLQHLPVRRRSAADPVRALKLYDVVRTAHLERISPASPITVLYRSCRYDFHAERAAALRLRKAGAVGTFLHALREPYDIVEINEPLVARAAVRSLAAIAGNRLRARVRGEPAARIVSYAIASVDPAAVARDLSWRGRLRWRAQWSLVSHVWRRVDRLAIGTDLAARVYRRVLPDRWPEHRVIPAVPAPRAGASAVEVRPPALVFLGDLSTRKGFPEVLAAWRSVRERVPHASLSVLGRGAYEDAARELARRDERVAVQIDPPRDAIFQALESAKVLVLPSNPSPRWREQVGLPIVEALASGCLIVTTTETGIADWLRAHGHSVVRPGEPLALATAIERALTSRRRPSDVLADLPEVDGRMAAEHWLYEGFS